MSLKGRWRCVGLWLLLAGCEQRVVIDAVILAPPEPGDDETPLDALEPVEDAETELGDGQADDTIRPPSPLSDAAGGPLDASAAVDATTAEAAVVDSGVAQDARADDARADTGLPSCGGTRVWNLCWYLGEVDTSCDQVCSGHAGNDGRAAALVGTAAQGGDLNHCTQVLLSLGYTGSVFTGIREQLGMGCHIWDAQGWWIEQMPAFSTAAKTPNARIACACLR